MKNTKLPNLISILVLTLLTAVTWISFGIYRAFTTKPAPVVKKEVSEPLNPTLDKDVINSLGNRLFLNDQNN
ncbi:MAG TPA: hypothetical protein VL401_00790 [Alphaproteobacteria bacterium]|jgi:hypothetical protein|nr:hypothetical protein [Alphaproteobacteria bacterium]